MYCTSLSIVPTHTSSGGLQDQLKAEIKAGRVFRHLREGTIRFPPTYKFNKNDPDPFGYDSSEKRRVPAWTDRIFFRGSLRKDMLQDVSCCPVPDQAPV